MSELFREVDEMMRQERMQKFWDENGNYIIAFIIGTILLTAAISGYRAWDRHVRIEQTNKAYALIESAEFPGNVAAAEPDLRPGLRGIVLLNAAQKYMDQDQPEEAFALYTKAAQDSSIPDDLRDLAILSRVRIMAGQEQDQKNLAAMLQPVWENESSPWRFQARLDGAALLANQQGEYAQARTILEPLLTGAIVPQKLAEKAKALDHVYAMKTQESQTQIPSEENPSEKAEKDGS